jgi:hypothetical protein
MPSISSSIMTSIRGFVVLSIVVMFPVILTIVIMSTVMALTVLSIIIVATISSSIMTTVSPVAWITRCSSCCRIISCEMGRLGSSDFWGVVDGQGCPVVKSGAIGVPVVSRPSVHHGDSGQAEERDLKYAHSLQLSRTMPATHVVG